MQFRTLCARVLVVVVAGTPEKVAATARSATGEYLKRVLKGEPIIPMSNVSFAEAAGRAVPGNGKTPKNGKAKVAIKVEKAATAARR